MKTRFISFETDIDTDQRSVLDIVELSDGADDKTTRRRIMRQLGFLVDQMIRDRYVNAISVEREE